MKLRFLTIFILGIIFFAPVALAAGVGFVPSSRLWFSDLSNVPAEGTKIYTVIINNDYEFLDAKVGFYINDRLMDTVDIIHLAKEQAAQVRGVWHPVAGDYKISVQFVKAVAIDANGQKTDIDIGTLNNITDSDVKVGGTSVVSGNDPATSSLSLDASLVPAVDLQVQKVGDDLSISPALNPIKDFEKRIEAASQQQEDIKNKINDTVNAVSSTVASVSNFQSQAKSLVSRVKDFFRGDNIKFHLAMVEGTAANFIDQVTDHYEPKRSAIAFGLFLAGLILLYTIFWFWRNRRD